MADALVMPSLIAFGGALAVGLGGIAAVERTLQRLRGSVLFARWRSWVAITLLLVPAVVLGPAPLAALAVVVTGIGLWEYARLARLGWVPTLRLIVAGCAVTLGIALGWRGPVVIALGWLLWHAAAPGWQANERGAAWASVIGLIYIAVPLGVVVLAARQLDGGQALVLATALGVALGDVGAYIAGRSIGGPRLAPRVSPGKRWSGLIGNAGGAVVGLGVFELLIPGGLPVPWLPLVPVVAAAAVLGDLVESAMKRRAGVKDAGGWLPGFGGLLDRIDSLLLALPAAAGFALISAREVLP